MFELIEEINHDQNISPQFKTAIAVTDLLFGPVKVRKPTQNEMIEAAIATANRLDQLLLEIAKTDPHNANIEEAQEFAEGIFLNIAGYRKELNAPYMPCDCGGKCDACVAARSDEHHDRKRDGIQNIYP